MKNRIIVVRKISIFAITLTIILNACAQNTDNTKEHQQQQLSTQEDANEVPDELKKIESNLEKIINILDGPSAKLDEDEKENQNEQKKQDDTENEQKKNQNNQEQKNEGNQTGNNKSESQENEEKSEENQKESEENEWEKINPIMNKLHYQWHSFVTSAFKMNASKDLIENFSSSLNNLTNTIAGQNKVNTLLASSKLYSYIPDLYMLYKTPSSPEIKRIRHYSRNAMLNAMTEDWDKTEEDLERLKSTWSIFKNTVQNKHPDSSNKLNYSIQEFEKVIKEKNQYLSNIKGRVLMNHIDGLEKEEENK